MSNPLNLRSVDLNLLVFFDALMTERHVTRAANKVAVSQSAMSNALARLRCVFDDELFVRTARGMEPTPRASELGESIHRILQQTTRLMASDIQFDPTSSNRQFVARMSDLVGTLLLPKLMERLGTEAPGVSLDIMHLSPEETLAELDADRLDVAISMGLSHTAAIRSDVLFQDKMVCLFRQGHPLTDQKLTLRRFVEYSHLRVAVSPTDIRFVDSVLASKGLQRNVALKVPHWLLVPKILEKTDLLAVMSERVAREISGQAIQIRPLPFSTDSFSWNLYWHRRYEHSRAHEWLRSLITSVGQSL